KGVVAADMSCHCQCPGGDQDAGGQEISSGGPSGSLNDSPEPYRTSGTPPCGTPSASSIAAHCSSSVRFAQAKDTWSRPTRRGVNGTSVICPSGKVCSPNRVPPSAKTTCRKGPVSSSRTAG